MWPRMKFPWEYSRNTFPSAKWLSRNCPEPAWDDLHGLYSEPSDDDAVCDDDVDDELDCCHHYAQLYHCIEFREGYASTASLHNAAVLGDVARLEELLASGVDANMTDGVKATPLHLASRHGHSGCVEALLIAGGKVDAHYISGQTPVMLAAANGHCSVLSKLLGATPNSLNSTDRVGLAALHMAAKGNHMQAMKLLLQAGAQVDVVTGAKGRTPLHLAAWRGSTTCVSLLLAAGANVDAADSDAASPLQLAIRRRHKQCAITLVAAGANLKGVPVPYTKLLKWAIEHGHTESTSRLLVHGRNTQTHLDALLYTAICRGDLACTVLLLRHGARASGHTRDGGRTPLSVAAFEGQPRCLQALVQAGADVNERSQHCYSTALHVAARRGRTACVKVLLRAGAYCNAQTQFQHETPVQCAVGHAHADCVAALVMHGAIVDPVSTGSTPLHHAIRGNDIATVGWLLAGGADVNVKRWRSPTEGWQSALQLAVGVPNGRLLALVASHARLGVLKEAGQGVPVHLGSSSSSRMDAMWGIARSRRWTRAVVVAVLQREARWRRRRPLALIREQRVAVRDVGNVHKEWRRQNEAAAAAEARAAKKQRGGASGGAVVTKS